MAGAHLRTCRSQDVGRVQEILGDDAHSPVELADPPAVDVVLLEPKQAESSGETFTGSRGLHREAASA